MQNRPSTQVPGHHPQHQSQAASQAPWLGWTTPASPSSLQTPSPASGPRPTLFPASRARLLPEPELMAPSAGGSAGIALVQRGGGNTRVRGALQTLSESAKERPPQATSLLPAGESPVGWAELFPPQGLFGALTPTTSGHDPDGKQGLHRENQAKSAGALAPNAWRPSKRETWTKRGPEWRLAEQTVSARLGRRPRGNQPRGHPPGAPGQAGGTASFCTSAARLQDLAQQALRADPLV